MSNNNLNLNESIISDNKSLEDNKNKDNISNNLNNSKEFNNFCIPKTTSNNDNKIWVNKIKADGGAYKGCPKNDYCLHYVETGDRPQNYIRDYEEDKRFIDYPKLNELIKRKNEIINKRATPATYLKTNLKSFDLSSLGKFDVILIDPPWEEYYVNEEFNKNLTQTSSNNIKNDKEYIDNFWSFEEIADLKIESISESCSFVFLWVGNGKGLDYGRALIKKWGFRRCEDIVWVKTNKHNNLKKLNNKSYSFNYRNLKYNKNYNNDNSSEISYNKEDNNFTILERTKEHCLVGIKGQVKRGEDRHLIHANIDTDVIVSEETIDNCTEKPQELYRIIERFCLGRKRLELFGEDHNIRNGWLTIGGSLTSSNYDSEKYNNYFIGDIMYPEAQNYEGGKYVGSTPEIESLRPRSPKRNNYSQNNLINNNYVNHVIDNNSKSFISNPMFRNPVSSTKTMNYNLGLQYNFNPMKIRPMGNMLINPSLFNNSLNVPMNFNKNVNNNILNYTSQSHANFTSNNIQNANYQNSTI